MFTHGFSWVDTDCIEFADRFVCDTTSVHMASRHDLTQMVHGGSLIVIAEVGSVSVVGPSVRAADGSRDPGLCHRAAPAPGTYSWRCVPVRSTGAGCRWCPPEGRALTADCSLGRSTRHSAADFMLVQNEVVLREIANDLPLPIANRRVNVHHVHASRELGGLLSKQTQHRQGGHLKEAARGQLPDAPLYSVVTVKQQTPWCMLQPWPQYR